MSQNDLVLSHSGARLQFRGLQFRGLQFRGQFSTNYVRGEDPVEATPLIRSQGVYITLHIEKVGLDYEVCNSTKGKDQMKLASPWKRTQSILSIGIQKEKGAADVEDLLHIRIVAAFANEKL